MKIRNGLLYLTLLYGGYQFWSYMSIPSSDELPEETEVQNSPPERSSNHSKQIATVKAMAKFLEENPRYASRSEALAQRPSLPSHEAPSDPVSLDEISRTAAEFVNLDFHDPVNMRKGDEVIEKVTSLLSNTPLDQIETRTKLIGIFELVGARYPSPELKNTLLNQVEFTANSNDHHQYEFHKLVVRAYINIEPDPEIRDQFTQRYDSILNHHAE